MRASESDEQKMFEHLPETLTDRLRESVAGFQLHGYFKEMFEIADAFLMNGVYDDNLLAIVDASPSRFSPLSDRPLEESFLRFLANVSFPVPDSKTAIWQLLYFHIRRIANCDGDEFILLDDMIQEVCYTDQYQKTRFDTRGGAIEGHFFEGYYGVSCFYSEDIPYYHQWSQSQDEASREDMRRWVKDVAIDWLARFSHFAACRD